MCIWHVLRNVPGAERSTQVERLGLILGEIMEISDRFGMVALSFRPTKNDAGGLRVSWAREINGRYFSFSADTWNNGTRTITVYLHEGRQAIKRHEFSTV